MDFLSDVAEFGCEKELHLGMHVLHTLFNHELAALYRVGDLLKGGEEKVEFLLREEADLLKHLDVGHGALHVVAREAEVKLAVAAYCEVFYELVGLVALVPKLHIFQVRGEGLEVRDEEWVEM